MVDKKVEALISAIDGLAESLGFEGRVMVCPGKRPGHKGVKCYPRYYPGVYRKIELPKSVKAKISEAVKEKGVIAKAWAGKIIKHGIEVEFEDCTLAEQVKAELKSKGRADLEHLVKCKGQGSVSGLDELGYEVEPIPRFKVVADEKGKVHKVKPSYSRGYYIKVPKKEYGEKKPGKPIMKKKLPKAAKQCKYIYKKYLKPKGIPFYACVGTILGEGKKIPNFKKMSEENINKYVEAMEKYFEEKEKEFKKFYPNL